jgi:hypothetical protein
MPVMPPLIAIYGFLGALELVLAAWEHYAALH